MTLNLRVVLGLRLRVGGIHFLIFVITKNLTFRYLSLESWDSVFSCLDEQYCPMMSAYEQRYT